MQRSALIFWGFVFMSVLANAQATIDYMPKSLARDLCRQMSVDKPMLKEILTHDDFLPDELHGKYFQVSDSLKGQSGYLFIGRVNCCRMGGCAISSSIYAKDQYEFFDYYIIYGSKLDIKQVKIYNYQATHGHEITARGWLKQFVGFDGSNNLRVGKNIDAISGATISVYSITADIEERTKYLNRTTIVESRSSP